MKKKDVPVLFRNKADCCACGACVNACSKQAISIKIDKQGFMYPEIDTQKCVMCGKCKTVCAYQNSTITNSPMNTYAAVTKRKDYLRRSASGGVFSAIAEMILKSKGVVVGAAFDKNYRVRHLLIDSINDLWRLQGSKYVQSAIGDSYKKVQNALTAGKYVLFSGTPCQVDGLYSFLGKQYDNLYTVDIICHGVPNGEMFEKYVAHLQNKYGGDAERFLFRDKALGWGINGSITINGKKHVLWQEDSSYFSLFSKGVIYRENCYSCKYACQHRPADITLGDYWGIERQHPEFLKKNGWDVASGISVVIVNSIQGNKLISLCKDAIELRDSTFEKASRFNAQLRKPSSQGIRDEVLAIYTEAGWDGVEKLFQEAYRRDRFIGKIKRMLPKKLKMALKKIR